MNKELEDTTITPNKLRLEFAKRYAVWLYKKKNIITPLYMSMCMCGELEGYEDE
jgi:hypothetical protein